MREIKVIDKLNNKIEEVEPCVDFIMSRIALVLGKAE